MALITIDQQKCTRCGLCTKACPVGIIVLQDEFPSTVAKIEKGCITCGHCVAVCPSAALSHCRMTPEQCSELKTGWRLSPEQLEQLIKGRRSIRSYQQKPVDRAVLEQLLDMARYAPSGMNTQSVHWLVITDAQEVQRLSFLVIEWLRQLQAQGVRLGRGMVKAWEMGQDPVLRKAPHLIVAHGAANDAAVGASATIALATLELAALSFGLGTCWAGFLHQAVHSSAGVAMALDLPPGHRMIGGLLIGYPELEYARVPARKPAAVTWR
jgi:nitroreductase/NAD-dependent dihydropyrimidine dehydrogenase PreA subunit